MNPERTVARIDFAIAGNGDNAASIAALHTLRDEVIPPIARTLPDTEVAVTGITAGTYDFNTQMRSRLPYVFLFVLGLAFVLLLLTFRSRRDRRHGRRPQPALGRRGLRHPRARLPARLARGRCSASRRTERS